MCVIQKCQHQSTNERVVSILFLLLFVFQYRMWLGFVDVTLLKGSFFVYILVKTAKFYMVFFSLFVLD